MKGAGCIDEMDRAIKAVLSKYSSPCYQKIQEAMKKIDEQLRDPPGIATGQPNFIRIVEIDRVYWGTVMQECVK